MCCVCVTTWYFVMANRIHVNFRFTPTDSFRQYTNTRALHTILAAYLFSFCFILQARRAIECRGESTSFFMAFKILKCSFSSSPVDSAVALYVLVLICNVQTRACRCMLSAAMAWSSNLILLSIFNLIQAWISTNMPIAIWYDWLLRSRDGIGRDRECVLPKNECDSGEVHNGYALCLWWL